MEEASKWLIEIEVSQEVNDNALQSAIVKIFQIIADANMQLEFEINHSDTHKRMEIYDSIYSTVQKLVPITTYNS